MEVARIVDEIVAEAKSAMGRPPGDPPVTILEVRLDGVDRDAELVIIFQMPNDAQIYGHRVPLWDEDGLVDGLGPTRFVDSIWLDIDETVMTKLGLPETAGAEGVAWIRTDV